MSTIDDAFKEARYEHGIKQRPNWNGTVYGYCQTRGCGNFRKVGYYEGGFCKLCSVRHPDDKKLPVLSAVNIRGTLVNMPNLNIRWNIQRWIRDLSDKLSEEERRMFYMTPEQLARRMDRVDYREPQEEEPDFNMERETEEEDEE